MIYELTIGGTTKRSKFTPVTVQLDWDKLPEPARQFAIRYGLKQYVADGVASAMNQAEFNEGVAERVRKLNEADFTRTRTERGPVDDVETLAMNLAKETIRAAAKVKGIRLPKERVEELAKQRLEGIHGQDHYDEAKRRIDAQNALLADVDLGAADAKALGIE